MDTNTTKLNEYFRDGAETALPDELTGATPEESDAFLNTVAVLEQSRHYSEEEMAEILLETGTPAYGQLMEHTAKCGECFAVYSTVRGVLNETEEYLKTVFPAETERGNRNTYRFIRYASAAAVAVIGALFLLNFYLTPLNVKLGDTGKEQISIAVRGSGSPYFQQGVLALDEKDYNKAIESFSKELLSDKQNEPAFYTHYLLGLSHLLSARSSTLGLFPRYNTTGIELAITELNRAVTGNRSGQYRNVTLDAFYYLGKANILLNKTGEARSYLQIVVLSRGSKMAEAETLLKELQ